MQFTIVASLVLALAHLGAVTGIPTGIPSGTQCNFLCQTDAQCGGCPGAVAPILQYTCVTLDIPDVDGVRFFVG